MGAVRIIFLTEFPENSLAAKYRHARAASFAGGKGLSAVWQFSRVRNGDAHFFGLRAFAARRIYRGNGVAIAQSGHRRRVFVGSGCGASQFFDGIAQIGPAIYVITHRARSFFPVDRDFVRPRRFGGLLALRGIEIETESGQDCDYNRNGRQTLSHCHVVPSLYLCVFRSNLHKYSRIGVGVLPPAASRPSSDCYFQCNSLPRVTAGSGIRFLLWASEWWFTLEGLPMLCSCACASC